MGRLFYFQAVYFSMALAVLGTGPGVSSARADIDGKPVLTPTDCQADLFSAADFLCKLLEDFGSAAECKITANSCAKGSQEMFVGNQIELASPTNIKNWSGFGGMGVAYQAANLCLLRDMKDAPIVSKATASTLIGGVEMNQTVQFLSFDPKTLVWEGYHRGRACAPVVGCMDVFSQKITARAVATSTKGSGKKALEYEILSSHAVDVQADGVVQALSATLPSISIYTPYGAVDVQPKFGFGRAMGYVLAPYDSGNLKSKMFGAFGSAKMTDLYGRNPGTAKTQTYPLYWVTGASRIDNRVIGYISQVAMGSRSADPDKAAWKAPAGEEFPVRPDTDTTTARVAAEKAPNAYLGADVKVAYSPVNLLPAAIRNNGYIKIAFDVWAKPTIDTGYISQFNLLNYEVSNGSKLLLPNGPVDYRPGSIDQFKGLNFFAGSSASARFALYGGINLNLHLHVPLPIIDDIDIDLVDLHPETTLAEKVSTGVGYGDHSAKATSQASKIASTGEWFDSYVGFSGPKPSGKQAIAQCLAAPAASAPPPPTPSYTPGNPQDLTKGIEYPCNICVGMNDYTYEDEKHVKHTINGFLQTLFPADQSVKPVAARWTCDHTIESGCFDMCKYNPATNKLTVVKTAIEMIAAGNTKKMPARCR